MTRVVFVVFVAWLAASCATALSLQPADIVIRDVTVIDAVSGERSNQDVLLVGDRVSHIGRHPVAIANKATEIDGRGRYLIPGLWDAHVHLTFTPGLAEPMLNLLSAHGITRVRDTGGALAEMREALSTAERMRSDAPTVYFAGPLLDGRDVVYNGEAAGYPAIGTAVLSTDDARDRVAELRAAGASLVKAYEMLAPETMRAIVSAADELGMPVASHIPLAMDVFAYLESGVDSLEHLRNLELACSANHQALLLRRRQQLENADGLPGRTLRANLHREQRSEAIATFSESRCLEVLDAIAKYRVAQGPTLALSEAVYERPYRGTAYQRDFKLLPASLAEKWLGQATFYGGPDSPFGPMTEASAEHMARLRWMVAELSRRNTPLLAGTDTPIFFMTPGASLHVELEALVRAGVSTQGALAAATIEPARYFGIENEVGSIAVDKIADLVLLRDNPLKDIRNTRTIEWVIQAGVLKSRVHLDQQIAAARGFTIPLETRQ